MRRLTERKPVSEPVNSTKSVFIKATEMQPRIEIGTWNRVLLLSISLCCVWGRIVEAFGS